MEERIFLQDKQMLVAYKDFNESMQDFNESIKKYLNVSNVNPIYDLDMQASGVVVYALDETTYNILSTAYKNNEFEFNFYAVTVGESKKDSGLYSAFVTQDLKSKRLIHIPQLNKGAIKFDLSFKNLQKIQQIQLVKIKVNSVLPETIRFAMADLNMPIFGDAAYKGDSLAKNTKTALSLVDVRFKKPNDEKYLDFKAMIDNVKPWNYFDLDKFLKI